MEEPEKVAETAFERGKKIADKLYTRLDVDLTEENLRNNLVYLDTYNETMDNLKKNIGELNLDTNPAHQEEFIKEYQSVLKKYVKVDLDKRTKEGSNFSKNIKPEEEEYMLKERETPNKKKIMDMITAFRSSLGDEYMSIISKWNDEAGPYRSGWNTKLKEAAVAQITEEHIDDILAYAIPDEYQHIINRDMVKNEDAANLLLKKKQKADMIMAQAKSMGNKASDIDIHNIRLDLSDICDENYINNDSKILLGDKKVKLVDYRRNRKRSPAYNQRY